MKLKKQVPFNHFSNILIVFLFSFTVLGRFNEVDPTAVPLYWNQSDFDGVNLSNVRICVIERDHDQKLVPAV